MIRGAWPAAAPPHGGRGRAPAALREKPASCAAPGQGRRASGRAADGRAAAQCRAWAEDKGASCLSALAARCRPEEDTLEAALHDALLQMAALVRPAAAARPQPRPRIGAAAAPGTGRWRLLRSSGAASLDGAGVAGRARGQGQAARVGRARARARRAGG